MGRAGNTTLYCRHRPLYCFAACRSGSQTIDYRKVCQCVNKGFCNMLKNMKLSIKQLFFNFALLAMIDFNIVAHIIKYQDKHIIHAVFSMFNLIFMVGRKPHFLSQCTSYELPQGTYSQISIYASRCLGVVCGD